VGLKDVDEVITVMGQPEDYIIEDENTNNQQTYNYDTSGRKSRNYILTSIKNMIGGVAAGLSHYLGLT
jgi:hypothetical protein